MLLAVILNISVSNAMVFIRLAVVIFVPNVDHPQSSLSLPRRCHLSLPTPVQAYRLEFLLSGYNHSIAEFCERVLERVFYIMKLLESCLMPPIYFLHWTTQRWSMPNLKRNARLAVWLALFIMSPFIHLEFLP